MWHNITFPNVFLFFSKRRVVPISKSIIKEEKKVEPNYYDFLLEVEKGKAKNNQILADRRLKFEINRDAINSFFAWNYFDFGLHINKGYCITLHNEETAKFKNQKDIDDYKREVFNRLRDEEIEKANDISLSLEEIAHIETHPWEFTVFTRCELIKRKNKLNNECTTKT